MPIGDMLKKIIGTGNELLFNPNSEPTGLDVMNAQGPLNENRGFWAIASNLGKLGAKQRVTNEQLRTQRAKEEADLGLKKAQTGYYEAGVGQREAQGAYTMSRIKTDQINAEIKATKNENDLVKIEAQLKEGMRRADAFMKMAEASEQRAQNDIDKNKWRHEADMLREETRQLEVLLNDRVQTRRNEIRAEEAATGRQRAGTYDKSVENQRVIGDRNFLTGIQKFFADQGNRQADRASREKIASMRGSVGADNQETIQLGTGNEMSVSAFKGIGQMAEQLEKSGNAAGAEALRNTIGIPKKPGFFESKPPAIKGTITRPNKKITVKDAKGNIWSITEKWFRDHPGMYELVK